jgi:DNA-binding CsgD family transcriptional regulator
MTYAEIAEAIGYRPLSVRNVIYGIQNKLKVKSKQELVVHAVSGGLLDA